jgi:hypothetical protein
MGLVEEQTTLDQKTNPIRSHENWAVIVDAPQDQVQEKPITTLSRPRYLRATVCGLLFGVIAAFFLINVERFSNHSLDLVPSANPTVGSKSYVDFDVFYLAAQMVWRGEIKQAYSFATMEAAQEAIAGEKIFMPWTYPPQFDLVVAPLALMPLGLAYGIFAGGTLIAYLLILRAIAGTSFVPIVLTLLPAITVTMACGQNGFLTGTLIGMTCLGIQKGRSVAGIPLGLMVIKPHLALALALYVLMARQWIVAVIAIAIVVSTSVLATVLLGSEIWPAFLGGVKEAGGFLEEGLYPLFRMISPYAALRTFGLTAPLAYAAQIIVALLSLAIVVFSQFRGFSVRQSLGLTAIASLLISPYAYDYDLPIYGIGVALLISDLRRLGTTIERAIFYSLSFLIGLIGLAQTRLEISLATNPTNGAMLPMTFAGIALVIILGLAWRIVTRDAMGIASNSVDQMNVSPVSASSSGSTQEVGEHYAA